MELITFESDAYKEIIGYLVEIKTNLASKIKQNPLAETWLDISETCMLLKISTRTLQSYRDNLILPFSQIAGKIYFKAADIDIYLEKHYKHGYINGKK